MTTSPRSHQRNATLSPRWSATGIPGLRPITPSDIKNSDPMAPLPIVPPSRIPKSPDSQRRVIHSAIRVHDPYHLAHG